jgi:hypothetical protein
VKEYIVSAFPHADEVTETGMTLRDYFAAAALQALISSRSCRSFEEAAFSAYEAADEMIAFRKQNE